MNAKVTLEFRLSSEPAGFDRIVTPKTMRTEGGGSKKRARRRLLFNRKWTRRLRRRLGTAARVNYARLLSAGEESALAERAKAGDVDAEQSLITANLGLVKKAVNDYTRRGVSEDDLIQEGNLGLIRAARRFDPSTHTTRFATYATYWIRCFMIRALASNSLLVHRAQQYERAFCQGPGALRPTDGPAPDDDLAIHEDRALVCAALRGLSPFEAWVIRERFGLGETFPRGTRAAERPTRPSRPKAKTNRKNAAGGAGFPAEAKGRPGDSYFQRSYVDMGIECGLSVFRLRQVEKTALDKLRATLAERTSEKM